MSYQPKQHRSMKVTEWTLAPELAQHIMARYPKVDGRRAEDRFRRHHEGKATRSQNFDSLFLNWVGEDADKIGEHHQDGTDYRGVPNETRDQWDAVLMRREDNPL